MITYYTGLTGARMSGSPCFICTECLKKFQSKTKGIHHNCVEGK